MQLLVGIIEEGLIYALVSFGAYITYKILDFPDMTVDGSFPLGMCITATMILKGVNPFLTLFISFFAGVIAGILTGIIHVKLKVRDLLSGIIVMTSLYSINLRIAGRANLPIFSKPSIFKIRFLDNTPLHIFKVAIILFVIVIVFKKLLDKYLDTKSGYLLRSVGDNDTIVTTLGKNKGNVKILGLAIANGFAALAGSIYAEHRGFFEISAGTGTLVIAVANVIIGMQIMNVFTNMKPTTSVILGSIVYRACIGLALFMGMPSSDLRIITAVLLLIVIVLNAKKNKKLIS